MINTVNFGSRVAVFGLPWVKLGLVAWAVVQPFILQGDVLDSSLKLRFAFDGPPTGDIILDTSSAAAHSATNFGATWVASNAGRSGVMRFDGLSLNRIILRAAPDLNSPVGAITFWLRLFRSTEITEPEEDLSQVR